MVFFTFPEDARWNVELDAVEFTVLLGEIPGHRACPSARLSANAR
jgi:hypothetical protein